MAPAGLRAHRGAGLACWSSLWLLTSVVSGEYFLCVFLQFPLLSLHDRVFERPMSLRHVFERKVGSKPTGNETSPNWPSCLYFVGIARHIGPLRRAFLPSIKSFGFRCENRAQHRSVVVRVLRTLLMRQLVRCISDFQIRALLLSINSSIIAIICCSCCPCSCCCCCCY